MNNMFECRQIIETLDMGLIVVDRTMTVKIWNRWMAHHSGIMEQDIVGKSLHEFYEHLAGPKFLRFFKSVFSFGNYAYFSQKLHKYLIPMKNINASSDGLEFMQQNCTAGPIRNSKGVIESIFITVQDVTEYVSYERKLIEMGKLDHLTKLYNRSHLEKRLAEEIERARRYGSSLAVFMIDVDHFKKINDTHGHLCGDQTLRELAKIMQHALRTMDVIGRYGGEEFCCILPETSLFNACILAKRMCELIGETGIPYAETVLRVSVSIGVAEYAQGADTLESLVSVADNALYRAKHGGRNMVACASSDADMVHS